MTTRETDEGFEAKKEDNNNNASDEIIRAATRASSSTTASAAAAATASASASSWSRLKDPRIVRVSRAFGGKDRHSKVCTVRGLRDRRVRLSVPTAIQLYDLQDRLNLNQPSKVVDWLLDAAKNEIDELPPLPNIPPPGTYFDHNLRPILAANKEGSLRIGSSMDWDDINPTDQPSGSNAWNSDHQPTLFRPKSSKEVSRDDEEESEQQHHLQQQSQSRDFESQSSSAYFSSNNFFSRLDQSSASPSLGFLNGTSALPSYNSLVRWDPSNLSLSQSGSSGLTPQQEDFHNFGFLPLQSSTLSSLPSGAHHPQQILVYHQPGSATATQSYFPSHMAEYGSGRPFHLLGTTAKLLPSQNDHHHHHQEKQNEDDNFHSR